MAQKKSSYRSGSSRNGLSSGHRATSLRSEARHRGDDAADSVHDGVAALRRGANQVADAAKGRFDDAKDAVQDKYDDAKDAATHAAKSVKGVIARNPVASIGIAAGVVIATGLILRQLRSRS